MSDSTSSSDSTEHRKRSPLTNQQSPKTIVIKQNVKNARKGPYAIKRKLDLNAVVIQRRFGEGSRPIFDRDDVRPNSPPSKTSNKKRKSISPTRTPDYNKNKNYNSSPTRKKRSSYSPSPKRKRTPEKVPYYADPIREQDRIKQKYKIHRGRSSRSRSRSPRKYRTRSRSPISRSRRRNTRSRSPSRSHHRSYSHRRTPSRDRERRRSLRRRSRSRSSSRKRSRNSPSYDRATAPQYIPVPTIPVPVEYAHVPAPRWMPPPVYPRYPVMPRPPPMYPVPYYPGYGAPMAALPPPRHYQSNHPRFRGGRAGRSNRNYSETARKTGT